MKEIFVQLFDVYHILTRISACILRETCNPYLQTQDKFNRCGNWILRKDMVSIVHTELTEADLEQKVINIRPGHSQGKTAEFWLHMLHNFAGTVERPFENWEGEFNIV